MTILTAGATGEINNNHRYYQRFMAKRKYSAMKRNKIEPAVMTMTFSIPTTSPNQVTNSYIDLSQVASLVNRRFYRQGINWAVAGFKFTSAAGNSGIVGVNKLPNTWVMSNAWEKSMRAWVRMNNEALAETDSVRPRFLDFKIYADAAHHSAGFSANLLPYSLGVNFATPGEWEPSKVIIPDSSNPGFSTEREMIATGSNYPGAGASGFNAVSCIEGYAASRSLPNILDPNRPDDAADVDGTIPANWMQAIFNEGTNQDEQVLEDMIAENNIAPYPFENDGINADTMYPGGANQLTGLQLHDFSLVTGTTIGGHTHLKGGNFPCGLVNVTSAAAADGTGLSLTLQVSLVPGLHRGYECESMTEM